MAGRYTTPTTPGSGPIVGALGRPTSMQPRPGIQRVVAKSARRKAEPEYYEPEMTDDDGADAGIHMATDPPTDEAEFLAQQDADVRVDGVVSNSNLSPQGSCCFCGNTEKEGVLVAAPMSDNPNYQPGIVVCDRCTDKLIDSVKAELPRRRLRLAMERLSAGPVDMATVEAVERLAGQRTDNLAKEDK